jgi:hypothetical protein
VKNDLEMIIIYFKVPNIPVMYRGTEDNHVNLASMPGM